MLCQFNPIFRIANKLNDDVKTQQDLWNFVCNPEIRKLAKTSGN